MDRRTRRAAKEIEGHLRGSYKNKEQRARWAMTYISAGSHLNNNEEANGPLGSGNQCHVLANSGKERTLQADEDKNFSTSVGTKLK